MKSFRAHSPNPTLRIHRLLLCVRYNNTIRLLFWACTLYLCQNLYSCNSGFKYKLKYGNNIDCQSMFNHKKSLPQNQFYFSNILIKLHTKIFFICFVRVSFISSGLSSYGSSSPLMFSSKSSSSSVIEQSSLVTSQIDHMGSGDRFSCSLGAHSSDCFNKIVS